MSWRRSIEISFAGAGDLHPEGGVERDERLGEQVLVEMSVANRAKERVAGAMPRTASVSRYAYYGSVAGSFTITNTLTDTGSGPTSSTFPTLSGTTTGWTHTLSTASTPAGGPYASNTFSWGANTTSSPTETVTDTDNAGNTNTGTTLTFVDLSAAPATSSIVAQPNPRIGTADASDRMVSLHTAP